MDWDTNATELLQFEKIRTPEIFLQSFEYITETSNNTTAISSFSDNTTYSITIDSSTQIIDTDDRNRTLRIYPALGLFPGDLDVNYIERINTFWLQFGPPTTRTHFTVAIIYLILTIFGCFGNALVIYMFVRCKSLRTPANTLVINLAISDFFMIGKCPIVVYNSFKLGPALGDLGCRLYGFFGGLTGTASITTLTAIAIDRYHVVVYPLDPLRSTTKLRSRLTLLFVWIYSFCFAIIPLLNVGLSQYVPEGFLTTCSFDYLSHDKGAKIFMFIFFIGAWLVPFTSISYCYFYILKVVASANSIQSSKDKNKTEFKLTAIVSGVILLWFIAWTPYAVVALLGITGNEIYLTPLSSMVPAIFCKISACVNPYVYAVTHPRFRMEFRRLFLGQTISVKRASTFRSSTMSIRQHGGSSIRMSTRSRSVVQDSTNNPAVKTIQQNNNMQKVSEELESMSSTSNTVTSQHHSAASGPSAIVSVIPAVSASVQMPTILTSVNHFNQNLLIKRENNICDGTSLCA